MNEPTIPRGDYARKKGEVVLREHEFDGIQEYDQKLPNWWLFTFYGAIALLVIYWVGYYHFHAGKSDRQRIMERISSQQEAKKQELDAALAKLDDATLVKVWATDPAIVKAGEATFTVNCVPCHAADLSATLEAGGNRVALPGLPLNDHIWKYGGRPMEIFNLINNGTPPESPGNNGARMQAWGQVLQPKQIAELVSYLISKNPEDFQSIRETP